MRYRAVGALLTLPIVVAGCSSSGSSKPGSSGVSSSGVSSSGGSGIDVSGAKKFLAQYVTNDNQLGVPKLDGPIPKSKTVDVVNCPVAVCTEVGTAVQQATKMLGWHYNSIPMNGTPQGYQQAWQHVTQSPGDAIINFDTVTPDSSIASYAQKANVPVVPIADNDPASGVFKPAVRASGDIQLEGQEEANWVIQDAGKPVKSVFIYDPSVTSIASAYPGYLAAMHQNCSACSVGLLKVSLFKIGPALAQQVVSYLQSNPDVKYAALGLGDLATGVPAAIKAAGIQNQVKLVTRAASQSNLQDVTSGGLAAGFTSEIYENGYWAVDTLLRAMDGKPLGPHIPGHAYLFTPSHPAPNDSQVFTVPGYVDQFKRAWGLS